MSRSEQLTLSDYHIGDQIHKSDSSIVYKGRVSKSLRYVAVKKFSKERRGRVRSEVFTLENLPQHTHIVKFYSFHETPNHLWIVTEYCAGGDLDTVITKDLSLPESTIQSFCHQLLSPLSHIHSNGFILGSLTPSNIVFDVDGLLKIGDFGTAAPHPPSKPLSYPSSSVAFMAPEVISGKLVGFQSDLWSLGMVLLKCALGRLPSCFFNPSSTSDLVTGHLIKELEGKYSENFTDFLTKLLEINPKNRINWAELINHDFIRQDLVKDLIIPNIVEENVEISLNEPEPILSYKDFEKVLRIPVDCSATALTSTTVNQSELNLEDDFPADFDQNPSSVVKWLSNLSRQLNQNDVKSRGLIARILSKRIRLHESIANQVSTSDLFLKIVNILVHTSNQSLSIKLLDTIAITIRYCAHLVLNIITPKDQSFLIDHVSSLALSPCPSCNNSSQSNDHLTQQRLAVNVLGELVFFLIMQLADDDKPKESEYKILVKAVESIVGVLIKVVSRATLPSDDSSLAVKVKKNTCTSCYDDNCLVLASRALSNVVPLLGELFYLVDDEVFLQVLAFIGTSTQSSLVKQSVFVCLSRIVVWFPASIVSFFNAFPLLIPSCLKSLGSSSSLTPIANLTIAWLLVSKSLDEQHSLRSDKKVLGKVHGLFKSEDDWLKGKASLVVSLLVCPDVQFNSDVKDISHFDYRSLLYLIEKLELLSDLNGALSLDESICNTSLVNCSQDNIDLPAVYSSPTSFASYCARLCLKTISLALSNAIGLVQSMINSIISDPEHVTLAVLRKCFSLCSLLERSLQFSKDSLVQLVSVEFVERFPLVLEFLIFIHYYEDSAITHAVIAVKRSLLKTLEVLCNSGALTELIPNIYISVLMPVMATLILKSISHYNEIADDSQRNVAPHLLRLLTELCINLFKPDASSPKSASTPIPTLSRLSMESKKLVERSVEDYILPIFPFSFKIDPLVLSSVKMASILALLSSDWARKVISRGILTFAVSYLDLSSPNNNIHNMRLVAALLPQITQSQLGTLLQGNIGAKIADIVQFVSKTRKTSNNPQVELFVQPTVEIIYNLIQLYKSKPENTLDLIKLIASEECLEALRDIGNSELVQEIELISSEIN
ncbi:hypothetical protein P9112_002531 [Eukaryota sp. TZLM1-RC]